MVLTYDAYSETLENQKEKEDRLTIIENQMKALLSTAWKHKGSEPSKSNGSDVI